MKRIWTWLTTPATALPTGLLLGAGLVGGILLWGGFHTVLEFTDTERFCVSCHVMRDTVYPEYKERVHFANASGVRATCPDCHVPKDWAPRMMAKAQASLELVPWLTGKLDTPEKFEAHRHELAERVWTKMQASDSRECRNCHSEHAMKPALQSPAAQRRMTPGLAEGQTCIDCHKGIAHELPDLSRRHRQMMDDLMARALREGATADTLWTVRTTPWYATAEDAAEATGAPGQVVAATRLQVLERRDETLRVRIEGWRQDGVDRVIYEQPGRRIFAAAARADATGHIEVHDGWTDPETGQLWHAVSLEAWLRPDAGLIDTPDALWAYGDEMYTSTCSTCHARHPTDAFPANQWIGTMKTMQSAITLDKEEYRFLLKYLQMHAADTGGTAPRPVN